MRTSSLCNPCWIFWIQWESLIRKEMRIKLKYDPREQFTVVQLTLSTQSSQSESLSSAAGSVAIVESVWMTNKALQHHLLKHFVLSKDGLFGNVKPCVWDAKVATYFCRGQRGGVEINNDRNIYSLQSGASCNALSASLPHFRFPSVSCPPTPPPPFLLLLVWMSLTQSPAVCALPSSISAFYDCYLHFILRTV